jgi:GNAT superfamily N-acetyltransferase
MAFQKSKAVIAREAFDGMSFDTRLKPSYNNATDKQIILALSGDVPVAYVFATIDSTLGGDKSVIPEWAPKTGGEMLGFYPDWAPERAGVLNHLYIREGYRGLGLGKKLLDMAMEWIWGFPDINVTFVYISNGNNEALDFYLRNGYALSHEVFGGFITAAYIANQLKK